MTVRFVGGAQNEFLDVISGYEEARTGLGTRFEREADRCISSVASHPDFYRLRAGGYRRVNLRGFPYYVAYVVRGETLWA